jgi:hypothetical protein
VLEATLVDLERLGWPGATAYDEAKSRLESRKNDRDSFLDEILASCEVDFGEGG